ncbi:MAG TPA: DNA replication/repair protein RecF [Anaerolineae bacterium]|nr:DNA replication/repair protein RecF [Anaerolineae bacterium]
MHLKHLSLTNFRNYLHLELSLPPGLILLQGDNAQGKTNLLEAIYLLATSRSPHAQADRQMIHWKAEEEPMPFARLVARVQRADALRQIEIVLVKTPLSDGTHRLQKRIRVDGLRRRAMDLMGEVNVVLFSPQDITLVAGPPGLRRRYLDATLCQLDPRYCQALSQYNRILTQRNHLLRLIREGRAGLDELTFWDDGLVEQGSYLIARRQEMLGKLDGLVRAVHLEVTGGEEELHLSYVPSFVRDKGGQGTQLPLQPQPQEEELRTPFRAHLQGRRREEIARGMTLVGPHRDDLRFTVGGVDMGVYGSRGQQRTLVLSLKLAEAELMEAEVGEQPILLLDDLLSELDGARRRYLTQRLDRHEQAILTTTDLGDYEEAFLARVLLLRVHGGKIERMRP